MAGSWEDKQDPVTVHPMALKVDFVLLAPGDMGWRRGTAKARKQEDEGYRVG